MIVFETQEEFEQAVMNVLHERLSICVSSDIEVKVSLWENDNIGQNHCISESESK